MIEQIDWWSKQLSQVACVSLGRPEVLSSLRQNLLAQSQGHHTIDRLEERGAERGFEALDDLP